MRYFRAIITFTENKNRKSMNAFIKTREGKEMVIAPARVKKASGIGEGRNHKSNYMGFDIVQRNYLNKIKELCEKFEGARWNNNASDNLEEVTKAVAAGRVETLLLEQNRIIPGTIVNRLSGTIETADLKDLEMGDLLNSIAEIATEKGTTVLVVSKEDMPSRSGLVALYRY
jgi:hypothetical protein